MTRFYNICGISISVEMDEALWSPWERTMSAFRVEAGPVEHRYQFEKTDQLDPPEGELVGWADNAGIYVSGSRQLRYIGATPTKWSAAYIRAMHLGNEHHIQVLASQFPDQIGIKTVLTSLALEHLLAEKGMILLHCSCIEYRGKAILFTAPSETGKSTQAELWKTLRGARIINGDRAAVGIKEGTATVYGIPFAGSSSYCLNESWPVAAIVSLGQSGITRASQLRGAAAFSRVWEGCTVNTWDGEDMARASGCVMELVSRIPVIRLECTPDETAIEALEAMQCV